MHDRVFAVVTLLLCCLLSIVAWDYSAPFAYEPVGPKAFPLLLLLLIAGACVQLLLRPPRTDAAAEPPLTRTVLAKVVIFVAGMVVYAMFFESLGFVVASILFGAGLARLYGGSVAQSLLTGLVLAIGLYLLFDRLLDVPLPLGMFFSLER